MDKKVLFAVDSFFQLILATNLRFTIYQDFNADIIIYDSTPNAAKICDNLKRTGAYKECYFAKTVFTKCGDKYSLLEKLPKYFLYIKSLPLYKYVTKKILGTSDLFYDVFIFNGVGALPECIYATCKSNNPELACYRIEDSFQSSLVEYGKSKGKVRKEIEKCADILFSRKILENDIKGYYFSEPKMVQYNFSYPLIKSPKISRNNKPLLNCLNIAFDYKRIKDDYSQKYIFFEAGASFFESNNEDVALLKIIADKVGKKNILIKLHPRTKKNRFSELMINTAETTNIPWELIQLNAKMENKILITTSSSAVISSLIYFDDTVKVIFLYKLMKHIPFISSLQEKYMTMLLNKYGKKKLVIPESVNELWQALNLDN